MMKHSVEERRTSRRIKVQIPVDVLFGSRQYALGKLVNLSRDGAAVEACIPLTVGQLYRFRLHGFGTWPGVIVGRFGARRHGVRFDADEEQKCQIDEIIRSVMTDVELKGG